MDGIGTMDRLDSIRDPKETVSKLRKLRESIRRCRLRFSLNQFRPLFFLLFSLGFGFFAKQQAALHAEDGFFKSSLPSPDLFQMAARMRGLSSVDDEIWKGRIFRSLPATLLAPHALCVTEALPGAFAVLSNEAGEPTYFWSLELPTRSGGRLRLPAPSDPSLWGCLGQGWKALQTWLSLAPSARTIPKTSTRPLKKDGAEIIY